MSTLLILLLDSAFIAGAIELSAWVIRAFFFEGADVGFKGVTVSATAGLIAGVGTSYLTGLHQVSLSVSRKQVAMRALMVGAATSLAVLLASHFVWYQALGRTALLLVGATSAVSVLVWRMIYARFIEHGPRLPVVVLGDGPREERLAQSVRQIRHTRYDVVGLLGDPSQEEVAGLPVLGAPDNAVDTCRKYGVGTVMVVTSGDLSERHSEALSELRVQGFEIKTAESTLMGLMQRVPVEMVDERWLLHLFEQLDQGRDRVKRMVDIGVAVRLAFRCSP